MITTLSSLLLVVRAVFSRPLHLPIGHHLLVPGLPRHVILVDAANLVALPHHEYLAALVCHLKRVDKGVGEVELDEIGGDAHDKRAHILAPFQTHGRALLRRPESQLLVWLLQAPLGRVKTRMCVFQLERNEKSQTECEYPTQLSSHRTTNKQTETGREGGIQGRGRESGRERRDVNPMDGHHPLSTLPLVIQPQLEHAPQPLDLGILLLGVDLSHEDALIRVTRRVVVFVGRCTAREAGRAAKGDTRQRTRRGTPGVRHGRDRRNGEGGHGGHVDRERARRARRRKRRRIRLSVRLRALSPERACPLRCEARLWRVVPLAS